MNIKFGKFEIYINYKRYTDKQGGIMIIKHRVLDEFVGGISSLCDDNLHVGFFDCDKWKPNLRKLEEIQEVFDLSTLYIIKTDVDKYHIMCLDKHTIGFWIDVMRYWDWEMFSSHVTMSLRRGKFILRITEKHDRNLPELWGMLVRGNHSSKSRPHYRFLNLRYGIPTPKHLDGSGRLETEHYVTIKARK